MLRFFILLVLIYTNLAYSNDTSLEQFKKLNNQSYFSLLTSAEKESLINSLNSNLDKLNDEQKLTFYFLANFYLKIQSDGEFGVYRDKGHELAIKLNDQEKLIYFSFIKYSTGVEESSLRYQQLIYSLDKLPPSNIKALTYLFIARHSNIVEKRFEQLESLYKGIEIAKSDTISINDGLNKNLILAELYNELGNFYSSMNDSVKSTNNYNKALNIFTKEGHISRIGMITFNLGAVALQENRYDVAKNRFNEVIELKTKLKEGFGLALGKMWLAKTDYSLGNFEVALENINSAIEYFSKRQNNFRLSLAYTTLAEIYYATNQKELALETLHKYFEINDDSQIYLSIKMYEIGIKILRNKSQQKLQNNLIMSYIDLQNKAKKLEENDSWVRIEAEAKLNYKQYESNILKEQNIQQTEFNKVQKDIHLTNLAWLLALSILALILFYFIFSQYKLRHKKAIFKNTDYLTGLLNRHAFFNKLEHVYYQSPNKLKEYLFTLNIDNFKTINNKYGLQVGDQILIEIAHLIKTKNINCKTFARVGGDEFSIICRIDDKRKVEQFAEKLRAIVEQNYWFYQETKIDLIVTISIGVVDLDCGKSLSKTIKKVENALEEAKKNGGNQFFFNGEIPSIVKCKTNLIGLNEFDHPKDASS